MGGGLEKRWKEKLLRSKTEKTLGGEERESSSCPLLCVSLLGLNIGLTKDANENQTARRHDFSAGICLSLLICFPFEETVSTAPRASPEQNTRGADATAAPQFLLSASSVYLCGLLGN